MTTKIKNKKSRKANVKTHEETPFVLEGTEYKQVNIEDIDFSPLNYRKYFSQQDLETFAEELKLHGIISPLTVRKSGNDRYELVAGERRLRAASIAKLPSVPIVIRELTDEQLTEIQLSENLQRENPHPLDEANAVKLMQDTGKAIDEIALRLGKSKQFVYARLKLLNLIEPIREMFFADAINIGQALEIAAISVEGQEQFFKDHCTKWKQKNFELHNLEWYLRPYKYDLQIAPFNIKDKNLLPEAGACTGCSFNSASLKSLFPEYAKQAVCTNPGCYMKKCAANLRIGFMNALQLHEPAALIFNGEPSEAIQDFLKQVPAAADLPRYDYHNITVIKEPEEPESEDYTDNYNDEEETVFDAEGYESAMEEYKMEKAGYQQNIESGKYKKALLERDGRFYPVLFSTDPPVWNRYTGNGKGLSMKSVQEAIKAGTATPEILQQAIEATLQREERAKEIDRDKIQLQVHKQFEEAIKDLEYSKTLTPADTVAIRLLIYQSLDYNSRTEVDRVLFEGRSDTVENANESFYQNLHSLTDGEFCYLIRMAIAHKSESRYPHNQTGYTLSKVAAQAGIDVLGIQQEQEEKAGKREQKMKQKIKELQKKMEQLTKKKNI